ncbi:hypothetical protein [Natroniella sp. ANB-PHB2]|uniref:hypothetical protein n=1 Tax=Natroniella sp. ANB-PHB2 TaxID=3384444 RepID=UPI0038D43DB1
MKKISIILVVILNFALPTFAADFSGEVITSVRYLNDEYHDWALFSSGADDLIVTLEGDFDLSVGALDSSLWLLTTLQGEPQFWTFYTTGSKPTLIEPTVNYAVFEGFNLGVEGTLGDNNALDAPQHMLRFDNKSYAPNANNDPILGANFYADYKYNSPMKSEVIFGINSSFIMTNYLEQNLGIAQRPKGGWLFPKTDGARRVKWTNDDSIVPQEDYKQNLTLTPFVNYETELSDGIDTGVEARLAVEFGGEEYDTEFNFDERTEEISIKGYLEYYLIPDQLNFTGFLMGSVALQHQQLLDENENAVTTLNLESALTYNAISGWEFGIKGHSGDDFTRLLKVEREWNDIDTTILFTPRLFGTYKRGLTDKLTFKLHNEFRIETYLAGKLETNNPYVVDGTEYLVKVEPKLEYSKVLNDGIRLTAEAYYNMLKYFGDDLSGLNIEDQHPDLFIGDFVREGALLLKVAVSYQF